MTNLPEIMELSDAELDAVAGGQPLIVGGLVNVALSDINLELLNNSPIDIEIIDDVTVTLRDIAKHNNIGVGALIQVLGGPGVIRQNQMA
jgi:hypothetical protein